MAAEVLKSSNPVFGERLRLPIQPPEWWGKLSPERAVDYINSQLAELVYLVAVDRYIEWENMDSPFDNEGVDANRRKIGYYQRARELQERGDALFRAIRPDEAQQISSQLGSVDQRWVDTQRLVYTVSQVLGEPKCEDFMMSFLLNQNSDPEKMMSGAWEGKPRKLIVHGRAKSDFSIWAKLVKHGDIDLDEIFDGRGIQVIVEDDDHARSIQSQILQYASEHPELFRLMDPYKFKSQKKAEDRVEKGFPAELPPIRDYLDKPLGKYRSIRMYFIDGQTSEPFEIQITPINTYEPPGTYMTQMVHKARSQ